MAENASDKAKSNKTAKKDPAAKVEQAIVGDQNNVNGPVQPIQVVRNKPEEGNEESETVTATNKPNLQQGDEDNAAPLQTAEEEKKAQKSSRKAVSQTPIEDAFKDMGVDTSDPNFYNLNLEAERARNRGLEEARLNGGF